jgi:catechol 2,3-dioxygenase
MSIHPEITIGHVHLTVADLNQSLAFYRDLLGFEVTTRYGDSAVFLSAGGYHHHIGLNTWAGKGALPPPARRSGLYHFAILYPTRRELARILQRLIEAKYPLTGAADHGVSEAIYLDDPDGIGVELYVDRPRSLWKVTNDGEMEMITERLDIQSLLAEAEEASGGKSAGSL